MHINSNTPQTPHHLSHFDVLGLSTSFAIDPGTLERAYLEASRCAHPDFHNNSVESESQSAAINEAYATLKDPFRRADHLLTLLQGPSATELKDLPPLFLMEMMELREQIELADPGAHAALESEIRTRYHGIIDQVAKLFEAPGVDPVAIRKQLNMAKYLKGLLRDLRGA